jgi:short-subunit dehydrogenase
MKQLQGKVALVTGASKGLGLVIANALAKEGVDLVLTARSADALSEACRTAQACGVRALPVPVDLSTREAVELVADRAEQVFGGVDLLINNAGVLHTQDYALLDPDAIDETIRLNLRAPMLLTRRLLPGMIARGEGHIVNISSVAGLGGAAYTESYSATKHALVGFTRSLRLTLEAERHPVGVSVVCPGFVPNTGMFHDNMQASGTSLPARFGTATAESVARAVIRAIQRNQPEVVVNSLPVRPIVLLLTMFPSIAGRISRATGIGDVCHDMAHAAKRTVQPRAAAQSAESSASQRIRVDPGMRTVTGADAARRTLSREAEGS